MKILFCVTKSDLKTPFLQQPVEVLYTGTILQQMGHDVAVWDVRVGSMTEPELSQHSPDLVFLVTQTYDLSQCYALTLNGAKDTVQLLRAALPGVPIVTVGMHGSIETAVTSRTLDTDLTLPGELESAIPWLVEHYQNDPHFLARPLAADAVPLQVDPATLPVPNYSLIDVEAYRGEVIDRESQRIRYDKAGLIFANRGCPYTCAYCFVWFGRKIRYRPVALIIEELRQQAAHGVRHFFFLDYTFTLDKQWVRQLCTALKAAELEVSWICQTRCERVDRELLQEMKDAGCAGIFYGVESPWISQTHMVKPTPREVIDRVIRETNEVGIRCFLFILLGLENQDPAIARQLLDWLSEVPATFHYSLLLPRPHTTLWDMHAPADIRITSWEDFAAVSQSIGQQHYWCSDLEEFQASVQSLPNYVVKASAHTV
ncbi:MAG TPA: radical SAM protein [Herpetosiphonaceae bacterium]